MPEPTASFRNPQTPYHRHAGSRYGRRFCVSCRTYHLPSELIRLMVTKNNTWHINPPPTLHGRSAYCCQGQPCLQQALRQRRFSKALKRAMPDGIVEDLNRLIPCDVSP